MLLPMSAMDMHRLAQGIDFRPSPAKAVADGIIIQPSNFGGFRQAHLPTLKFDHVVGARVTRLLHPRRPSAVVGRVPLTVVNALDRMSMARARPHVCDESGETAIPTVTNGNPTAAIARIGTRVTVLASLAHANPIFIKRVRLAMSVLLCHGLAAATVRRPFAQMVRRGYLGLAAITDAPPLPSPAMTSDEFGNNEQTKSLPDQTDAWQNGGWRGKASLSHGRGSFAAVVSGGWAWQGLAAACVLVLTALFGKDLAG